MAANGGCSVCGGDRYYTAELFQGVKRLVVKCMSKDCGHVELPPRPFLDRVAMGRIWP